MRKYNIFILFIIMSCWVQAQTSINGGSPRTLKHKELKEISRLRYEEMPTFDIKKMLKEDSLNQGKTKKLRFAKGFNVSLSLNNSGTWEELPNGDRVWRLIIKSKNAYSINLIFTEFNIPDSATLYIFNKNLSDIIGAFTSLNNTSSHTLATMPVEGDEIVIEYFEPKNVSFKGKINIGKISHDYRGVRKACFDSPNGGSCKGESGSCEVDINCSQGSNWGIEKNAVCRIFIDGESLCTASLINNISLDGTPYLLTANHCVCSDEVANTVVAVFNYESPSCNGSDGSLSQSISGATLRANWSNSDFSLLQLNQSIPDNYNPYFLGWDRTSSTPESPVACIHHPSGDVKKISISSSDIDSDIVNFSDGTGCDENINKLTWRVSTWSIGATEGGSSGSALLDNNHRIIGQLYGGASYCGNPYNDYYGAFSSSWSGGGSDDMRLQNWLDPLNSSTALSGLRLLRNVAINPNTVTSGDILKLVNVEIQDGEDIIIDIKDKLEITGTFYAPLGTSLNIYP